jgi:hypothetical protein
MPAAPIAAEGIDTQRCMERRQSHNVRVGERKELRQPHAPAAWDSSFDNHSRFDIRSSGYQSPAGRLDRGRKKRSLWLVENDRAHR